MRLENPVVGPVAVSVSEVAELNARDFDSAHNEAPVSFMRSSQIKTSQEAMSGNPELLEKYEALRAAVTRMLNETNVGITPIQKQAPTIQPHAAQVHSIAESEPVSVSQQGSTLRIFPMPR